jgi:peptidyl-prolyl cis-trans isomerase C
MSFAERLRSYVITGALAAATMWPGAANAQDQIAEGDLILARVNGVDITSSDIDQIGQDLRVQLARLPAEQRYAMILNVMIDIRLMARAAEAVGITDDAGVQRRLANNRDNQLRAEYLRVNVFDEVTDEMIAARYLQLMADFTTVNEVRARHILVTEEAEALAIVKDLDGGADFAAIAQELSIDPGSGRNGGDLGFFGPGSMVKPFSDAAFALDVGAYTSTPVQSKFGYHIIKVEETRQRPKPTLAESTEQIGQDLVSEALVEVSENLRGAADIQIAGPDGEFTPLPPREN